MKQALQSQKSGYPSVAEDMRVQRPSCRAGLGIIVRSVPLSEWNEGRDCPSVVIFVNEPEQETRAPQETVKALFGLTPSETQLTMLLPNGLSPRTTPRKSSASAATPPGRTCTGPSPRPT